MSTNSSLLLYQTNKYFYFSVSILKGCVATRTFEDKNVNFLVQACFWPNLLHKDKNIKKSKWQP